MHKEILIFMSSQWIVPYQQPEPAPGLCAIADAERTTDDEGRMMISIRHQSWHLPADTREVKSRTLLQAHILHR